MIRRNYRSNLNFIETGFKACWHNAQDLVNGAKVLLDNSLPPLALSTSVLALEELGKLFCIDGLLFARTDSYKAEIFLKSLKSHSTKLSAVELLPMLLGHIASIDPRYQNDLRFKQALAISILDLKEKGNSVLSMLKDGHFQGLDQWKQSGFYSQPRDNSFITPGQAVKREMAEVVYNFAWRASSTLDFLLKDGSLERYITSARVLRAKLGEEEHQAIETYAQHILGYLFSEEGEINRKISHQTVN